MDRVFHIQVDTIIDVARNKAAPLSEITETDSKLGGGNDGSDNHSPNQRRLQQVLLYMRCLHLLSQTLEFSRAELRSKRLKPSTSVKNGELSCQSSKEFHRLIAIISILQSWRH